MLAAAFSLFSRRPVSAGVPVALITHLLAAALGAFFWHAAPRLAIDVPFSDVELELFAGGSGARLEAADDRIEDLEDDLRDAELARDQWHASFRQSETNRETEAAEARSAIATLEADHALELEAARQAGANAVRIIYQEPEYDQDHCPVRRVLDAGELRNAIGAAGPD